MKHRISALAAATMLCLTLLSVCLTCGLYARYTTNGGGDEKARVAKFGQLSLAMDQTDKVKLLPGSIKSVTLDPKVTMTASEVAVAVYVYVSLPEGSQWTYDDDTRSFCCGPILWTVANDWNYLENDGKQTYTFYRFLAPGDSLNSEPVVVGGIMQVPQNYDDYYGMSNTDVDLKIQFKVRAAQID